MPMVVRASGGSVRDALSLLDQLIAGSDSKEIDYVRATNLLGFTHDELMSEVVEAFAELDAAKAFQAVDKVIQSGQDARRFLEDLLERVRDLMLVASLGNDAKAILRGMGPEQFDLLSIQASRFGLGQLTQTAEATSKALSRDQRGLKPETAVGVALREGACSCNPGERCGRKSRASQLRSRRPPKSQL
jgi:DNA polymerase III subunit gamma/tau